MKDITKKIFEKLYDKCNSEGLDYALIYWGDWKEFEDTELWDLINAYKKSSKEINSKIDELVERFNLPEREG